MDFKILDNKIITPTEETASTRTLLFIQIYQDKLAKFLTPFDVVPYWKEFPFDLSYIYTEKLDKFVTIKRDVLYDKEGNIINTIDPNIDINNKGRINRISFSSEITNETCSIETQIINTGVEQRDYEASDYETSDYN